MIPAARHVLNCCGAAVERGARMIWDREVSAAAPVWLLFCRKAGGPVPRIRDNLERWRTVGHKFSLVLSRVLTDDESSVLLNAGCAGAVFATDSLPTNAGVTVTKMDFEEKALVEVAAESG
jgi:hypothetical protein